MFLPYMYMHAYTIYAYTLYAGGGGGGGGWGGGTGQKAIYYICISFWGLYTIHVYTHIVYMLLRVACTYAQLFGNRRLAKSLIDKSIVPFWGLFTLALLFRNFKYDVIEAKPPYSLLLLSLFKLQLIIFKAC